jgi:hemoglobin/transferrin/lactoferrin receptor protein
MNFKVMYQFHPNFIITAGVENLLDVRYRPYSSGLTAPGRNLILALKLDF